MGTRVVTSELDGGVFDSSLDWPGTSVDVLSKEKLYSCCLEYMFIHLTNEYLSEIVLSWVVIFVKNNGACFGAT